MLRRDYEGQDCSLAGSLEVVGERWTLLIVRDAFLGVRRFNDFQAHLDIPRAVLSERLARLVEHGVMASRPDPRHGGRQLYELTPAGRELWPVMYALLVWGDRHRKPNSRVYTHAACGTRIDARGDCPACGTTPAPQELTSAPARGHASRREDPVALALRAPRRLLEPLDV